VDLQLTNQKLHERARRIIMQLTGVSYDAAAEVLKSSGYHVKTALIMTLGKIPYEKAQHILQQHDGFVHNALKSLDK